MKTWSIFSLAALAIIALSALAPTQASAWGRSGYGGGERFEGGFRAMRHFSRFSTAQMCEGVSARTFSPRAQPQAFASMPGYRPMRQAQDLGPAPQQGYAPPPRMERPPLSPRDAYEEDPESEARQVAPNNAPPAYASKELQK